MDASERRAVLRRLREQERSAAVAGSPLDLDQMRRLLDYLDANLGGCEHSLRLTHAFVVRERLDDESVVQWLQSQGGYCDCEALGVIEDLLDLIAPQQPRSRKPSTRARTPRSLANPANWNLASLPSEWRVANLYEPDEALRLKLGKRDVCTLIFLNSPIGGIDTDASWTERWHTSTGLPADGVMTIERDALDLPVPFSSVVVGSQGWVPVRCWIYVPREAWHIEACTELDRRAGDLREISRLVRALSAGAVRDNK